jgi:hypothetical protein
MSKFAARKAIPKSPTITGWVTECTPDDLSVSIRHCTLGYFPDNIRNLGSFVENQYDTFTMVVETSERCTVLLTPRNHVDPPSLFVFRVDRKASSGSHLEK